MERVEVHGPLHPQLAIDAIIEITRSIGHAHENGVIHRDIKPHNVLISTKGEIKMTDFGIARVEDGISSGLTQTGAVMGTVAYMAPEQRISAKNVTYASDIYALAATLYVLITNGNPVEIYDEDEQEKLFEGLSDDISAFLKKGCHSNKKARFQTCEEMIEALKELKRKVEPLPSEAPTIFIEGPREKKEANPQELSQIQTLLSSYGGTTGSGTQNPIHEQATQNSNNGTLLLDDFAGLPINQSASSGQNSFVQNTQAGTSTTIIQQQKTSSVVILGGFALIALAIVFGLQQLKINNQASSQSNTTIEPSKTKTTTVNTIAKPAQVKNKNNSRDS